jgi:hypothetical protein
MSGLPVTVAHRLEVQAPEQRWLIEGLWSAEAVGLIGGQPKSCKSFLALQMAVAVASGRPCLGRFAVRQPGRVLLYAAEDALHIVRERLDGLCAHVGVDLAALDLWVITAPTVRIDLDADSRRLAETVGELQPRLLILDPFVRLHRIDENVSAAVAPLLASLRVLQRHHGCAVVVVHHARKATATRPGQGLRGSSEFHAWGDSNLYLRRSNDRLRLTVEHRAHAGQRDLPLVLDTSQKHAALVLDGVQSEPATPTRPDPGERVQAALRDASPQSARALRASCRMRAETLGRTLNELEAEGVVERHPRGWSLASRHRTPSPIPLDL